MKIFRDVPETPSECPRTTGQSSCEKYYSITFHHFRTKYFSSNQNFPALVLDIVTTEWAHSLHDLLNTHREPSENSYSQNKFAISENKPNKNRKFICRSEILAVQISPQPHSYYFISICRISLIGISMKVMARRPELNGGGKPSTWSAGKTRKAD